MRSIYLQSMDFAEPPRVSHQLASSIPSRISACILLFLQPLPDASCHPPDFRFPSVRSLPAPYRSPPTGADFTQMPHHFVDGIVHDAAQDAGSSAIYLAGSSWSFITSKNMDLPQRPRFPQILDRTPSVKNAMPPATRSRSLPRGNSESMLQRRGIIGFENQLTLSA